MNFSSLFFVIFSSLFIILVIFCHYLFFLILCHFILIFCNFLNFVSFFSSFFLFLSFFHHFSYFFFIFHFFYFMSFFCHFSYFLSFFVIAPTFQWFFVPLMLLIGRICAKPVLLETRGMIMLRKLIFINTNLSLKYFVFPLFLYFIDDNEHDEFQQINFQNCQFLLFIFRIFCSLSLDRKVVLDLFSS